MEGPKNKCLRLTINTILPYICTLNERNSRIMSARWSEKQIKYFMTFCKPILRHLFKYKVGNIQGTGQCNNLIYYVKKLN